MEKLKINKRYVYNFFAVVNIFNLKNLCPVTESQATMYIRLLILGITVAASLVIHGKTFKDDECVNPKLYYGYLAATVVLNLLTFVY